MIRRSTVPLLTLVTTLMAACGDAEQMAESPQVRFEREAAYRQACVAQLLADQASDDLQLLEETLAQIDPADPTAEINRRAAMAALEYARGYERHAELRVAAYAYMDSAVNHAPTSADSARFIERAGAFSIRAPQEGTVEANVLNSYQSDMANLLANENHPCNWDFPS